MPNIDRIDRKIRLTDAAIQRLKAPASERHDYTDLVLPAFRLRISGPTPRHPDGAKTFSLIYRYAGTQSDLAWALIPP